MKPENRLDARLIASPIISEFLPPGYNLVPRGCCHREMVLRASGIPQNLLVPVKNTILYLIMYLFYKQFTYKLMI